MYSKGSHMLYLATPSARRSSITLIPYRHGRNIGEKVLYAVREFIRRTPQYNTAHFPPGRHYLKLALDSIYNNRVPYASASSPKQTRCAITRSTHPPFHKIWNDISGKGFRLSGQVFLKKNLVRLSPFLLLLLGYLWNTQKKRLTSLLAKTLSPSPSKALEMHTGKVWDKTNRKI